MEVQAKALFQIAVLPDNTFQASVQGSLDRMTFLGIMQATMLDIERKMAADEAQKIKLAHGPIPGLRGS